jgi:hypothetical protein
VLNTSNNPVPVYAPSALPVTGAITVGGTPTVNVGNSPLNVNVGNAQLGVTGTVAVSNLASEVLTTRSADRPTKQPFAASFFVGDTESATMVTVPVGKMLVIEMVTAQAWGDASTSFFAPYIGASSGGISANHFIATTTQVLNAPTPLRYYIATSPVRIYCDPGSTFTARSTHGNLQTGGTITLSGHLADIP